jgi:hypothetical protein
MAESTDLPREPSQREPALIPDAADTVAPSRIHLAFALVAGFALIAVPLVLWVGPSANDMAAPSPSASVEAPVASASAEVDDTLEQEPASAPSDLVQLGKVWIDKCEKPGPGKTPPEQCDRQPWFEQALVRAIQENTACAPERSGNVSVVMRVDFRRQQVEVFAGKSGTIRGRPAQGLLACIKRSIPDPDWNSLEHEHTKYIIAVMATYPGK